jgi:Zn-dependent protease
MGFLNQSFKVGRLFGIDIYIHMLFVVWAVFRLAQSQNLQFTLVFLMMIYGIVLIHEYGHCLGARWVGGDAHRILLWPLGGIAYPTAPMRPWPQFVTIAAGPIVHPIFCLISGGLVFGLLGEFHLIWLSPLHWMDVTQADAIYQAPRWIFYVEMFYNVNLMLLAFNLLPIFPLDGGQMLRSILWPSMGLNQATVLSCQIGIVGAIGLGILGVTNGFNLILVAIAVMAGMTCFQHLQAARYGALYQDDAYTTAALQSQADSKPLLERLFKIRRPRREPKPTRPATQSPNPNPGGWEAKQNERAKRDAEIDRILKKVKETGMNSLSYIEQQTLKNATAQRQAEEREFQRRSNL